MFLLYRCVARCVQAAGLEIKFQMIVETDVGVLCRLRVFTLVRQLYQPQSLLATKVTSVTEPGIFLSEIFAVFSFTTHPPHLYKLISGLTGSFSVQWTITQYISVELAGWN